MKFKKFSTKESLHFGWETFKKEWRFFVPLFLFVFVIAIILDEMAERVKETPLTLSLLVNLLSLFVNALLTLGIIKIALAFVDGKRASYSDLFSLPHLFFRYFFALILYALIVLGGLILLIIPGIIWGLQFSLYQYAIVDESRGIIDSLKRSSDMTRGAKWDLLGFYIIIGLLNVLGILALGIGLLITMPISMLAAAHVYRAISDSEKNSG
ncbi:hypothetical protein L0Y49_00985 [bacterium]|nr:hypothetical protein [bacterium]